MDSNRLRKLAGVPLTEGMPRTTRENPLVVIWEHRDSRGYPEQGIMGHMHLSVAQRIHGFPMEGLAEELRKAGVNKRVKAGSVYLEYSKHNKTELKESNQIIEEGSVKDLTSDAVQRMADIFEQTIDKLGVEQGDSDQWSEVVNGLADMLHEELRDRGMYG